MNNNRYNKDTDTALSEVPEGDQYLAEFGGLLPNWLDLCPQGETFIEPQVPFLDYNSPNCAL